MQKELIALAISLVVYIILNATYILYARPLYEWSGTTLLPKMQEGRENYPFINWYSDYLEYFFQLTPTAFFLLKTNQRHRAFYYIVLCSFSPVLNNLMKVAWTMPRPFWEFQAVYVYFCQNGFGAPSGHTMWCVAVPTAISLDIRHSNPTKKLFPFFAFVFTAACTYSEAWTRLVLGVHTLD